MNFLSKCRCCNKERFGSVKYCPFCGTEESTSRTSSGIGIASPRPVETVISAASEPEIEKVIKPPVEHFTISVNSGEHGHISPATVELAKDTEKNFEIHPDAGYVINDVKVDGRSKGAITTYNFKDVRANHTIEASFSLLQYVIEYKIGDNKSEKINVDYGSNKTFEITSKKGWKIADVLVDGVSQGTITAYTFNNISSDHIIEAKSQPEEKDARVGFRPSTFFARFAVFAGVIWLIYYLFSGSNKVNVDFAQINLTSKPTGASVSIDGTNLGKTPLNYQIKTGKHDITLTKSGYLQKSVSVTLSKNENKKIKLSLSRENSAKDNLVKTNNNSISSGNASDEALQSDINQGIELFNNQEYDSAINKFNSILQGHPNNKQAREYLNKSKAAQQEVLNNWKNDLNKQ